VSQGLNLQFDAYGRVRVLRQMKRRGVISKAVYCVGDAMLWSCRAPGKNAIQVSYDRLADLAGVSRRTAVEAVKQLVALKWLVKEKTRVRVSWAWGVAVRQGRNIYRWLATPECNLSTTNQQLERKKEANEVRGWRQRLLQPPLETLEAIAARRMRALGLSP
jgi:hypothetical protein